MHIFRYIVAIIIPIITGFCVVRLIAYKCKYEGTYMEYLWLSIPIGFWLLSYLMFIGNWALSISFNFWIFLIVQIVIIIWIIAYLMKIKKLSIKELLWKKIEFQEKIHAFKKYGKLLIVWCLAVIGIQSALMWHNVITTPTYPNDAIANRNIRSKIFFINKDLVSDKSNKDFLGGWWATINFPLNVYLQKARFGLSLWERNDSLINIQSFLYFIAWLLLLFSLTYIFSKSLVYATIASLLLASIPILIVHGSSQYGDITIGIWSIITIVYGFLYIKSKEKFYLLASLLWASLAIRTKNEWLVMVYGWYCIMMGLYYLISAKYDLKIFFKKILILFVPLCIMIFWIIFRLKMFWLWSWPYLEVGGAETYLVSNVVKAFMENLFFQSNYNLLFAIFLLISIFNAKKIWKDKLVYIYVYIILILLMLILSPFYSNLIALNIQWMFGTSRFMISMIIGILLFSILYAIYNNYLVKDGQEE